MPVIACMLMWTYFGNKALQQSSITNGGTPNMLCNIPLQLLKGQVQIRLCNVLWIWQCCTSCRRANRRYKVSGSGRGTTTDVACLLYTQSDVYQRWQPLGKHHIHDMKTFYNIHLAHTRVQGPEGAQPHLG